MRYLFDYWDKLKCALGDKPVALFLDYDGTLTPIAQRPHDARIPAATRRLLRQLAGTKDINITIISGRPIEQLKKLVGLKGIVYVGNHGLEIEGPGIKFKVRGLKRHRIYLDRLKEKLDKRLSRIRGVFIEDKGLSLAVHYRLAAKKNIHLIKKIFKEAATKYMSGKMVLETRPPLEWDKGKAVLWLLGKQAFAAKRQVLPVYIGDDKTDEDAFRSLRNRGVTVLVGRLKHSCAKYYLKNTDEVMEFLRYVRIDKGPGL